eukprot:1561633-Amphidinium_carterae.1
MRCFRSRHGLARGGCGQANPGLCQRSWSKRLGFAVPVSQSVTCSGRLILIWPQAAAMKDGSNSLMGRAGSAGSKSPDDFCNITDLEAQATQRLASDGF